MVAYHSYYDSMGGMWTPAVRFLLMTTGAVFLLQWMLDLMMGNWFTLMFSLSSAGIRHLALWQLVTYMFLHGGLWHILLNMLGLFFFGPETERMIGTRRFIALYLVCGIIGGLGWLLFTGNRGGICLGASGAVFGVLGVFAALFPDRPVTLLLFFVLPVTMRAKTLALALGVFTLLASVSQPGNIAYAAHLAGGLAGFGYGYCIFNQQFHTARLNPRQWMNDLRWRWHRRKFKVISSPPSGVDDEDEPAPEEVDEILEKIAKWGIRSLSRRERDILERASRTRR